MHEDEPAFVEDTKTNFMHDLSDYVDWIERWEDDLTYNLRERVVAQFNQHVWQHWYERTGPCSECPYSCMETRMQPDFGGFNFDADIVIVAQDPGGGDGGRGARQSGVGRDDDEIPMLEMQRAYSIKFERSWSLNSNMPLPENDGPPSVDFNNSITGTLAESLASFNSEITLRDVYFTNAKKCPEYETDNQNPIWEDTQFEYEDINKAAQRVCSNYLSNEIEIIRPEVVIPTGKQAMKSVCSAIGREEFDLNWNDYAGVTSENEIVRDGQTDPKIVLTRHAGYTSTEHITAALGVASSYIS
jgi:uracil-DNA glycosylase